MTDIDLNFISRQLERVLAGQRDLRSDMQLLREEVRLIRNQLARIEDTVFMDVLDRLRMLETR